MGRIRETSFALSLSVSLAAHTLAFTSLILYSYWPHSATVHLSNKSNQIVIGDDRTNSTGIDTNFDDHPQTALESTQDQSWQSTDPAGHDEPFTSSVAMTEENQSVLSPPQSANAQAENSFMIGTRISPPVKHNQQVRQEDAKPQEPKKSKPQQESQSQTLAGDLAPQSDRHVDLFAKETAVDIRKGNVVSQTGRQVKMAKPNWTLAGYWDGVALPATSAFEISIDPTGKPRLVTIKHSTGSESIDRAMQLAIYDSWFEPPKNNKNEPQSDTFIFTATIR